MEAIVNDHAQLLIKGALDSLSLHKTIPIIVNNEIIRNTVGKIFLSNMFMLVGSVMMFNKLISPSLDSVRNLLSNEIISFESVFSDSLVSFLFHGLWVTPILGLLYVVSMLWYQDLGDTLFKDISKRKPSLDFKKSTAQNLYAMIVWVLMFVQVQLLMVGLPAFATVFRNLWARWSPFGLVMFDIISFLSQSMGLFVMSILYGWYCFDYLWIAANIPPDTRFEFLQNYWAYFLGYGLPYVVLIRSLSFFAGYGSYLALFPFGIILATISDFEHSAKKLGNLKSMEIFHYGKELSHSILKQINMGFKMPSKVAKSSVKVVSKSKPE